MGDSTPARLAQQLLQGNRRAVGRIISLIEDENRDLEEAMRLVYPSSGHAYVVGITGPPGAGKSTVTDELIRVIRERDLTVGVIAIDPNSPFTGGAILGDRIRMMRHSADPGVFIRSMGARGHLGGLAQAARNTIVLLDAMGRDIVLVETVGVGQSELEVASAADTTVLVVPPGAGDGIQAIKAGIMEIADIFVVNKSDHPQAARTVADIRELLRMDLMHREWVPPIVPTIATQNQGLEDLWTRIEQHRGYQERSGELAERRRSRLQQEIMAIAESKLRRLVLDPRIDTLDFEKLLDEVVERTLDPYEAANRVVSSPGCTVGEAGK